MLLKAETAVYILICQCLSVSLVIQLNLGSKSIPFISCIYSANIFEGLNFRCFRGLIAILHKNYYNLQ